MARNVPNRSSTIVVESLRRLVALEIEDFAVNIASRRGPSWREPLVGVGLQQGPGVFVRVCAENG